MEEGTGSDVVGRTRLDDDEEGKLLPQDARRVRSRAARCNFIAADRFDIQFACKEVCRRMPAPCESDWKMLKSLARYAKSFRVSCCSTSTRNRRSVWMQSWTRTSPDAEEPESPRMAVA